MSALAALLLAFPAPQAPATSAGEVVVYSARHYDSDKQIYAAFEKATGIQVKLTEDQGDSLLARLRGGDAPGDVLVTVDAGNLASADAQGLFQPTRSQTLEQRIPAHLRHPQGHWFGLSMRARCIFYDKEKVQPEELSTYASLADPKWKGRILIRSSSNVYNQSLVGSLLVHDGAEATEAWARALVANLARAPQGGDTDQLRALAAGEGDVAVSNSYYYARLLKSADEKDKQVVERVGIVFPEQDGRGTHVNISGAGMLKSSANPENARRLLEYLAGDEAQAIFAGGNNEFPVVRGVPVDPVLAPWLEKRFDTSTPVAEFGARTAEALRLMDRAGWR